MKKDFVLLVSIFLAVYCFGQNDLIKCAKLEMESFSDTANLFKSRNPFTEWHDCVLGKQIPDFSLTSISGKKIGTENVRGKILVLNFWEINCPPCIAELPIFNRLVEDYKNKNVIFLAVTFETLKSLNADFFPKYKFDFNLVANSQSTIDLFGGPGYPKTFIVDKTGKIKEAWPGGFIDAKNNNDRYIKMKSIIDELLKNE